MADINDSPNCHTVTQLSGKNIEAKRMKKQEEAPSCQLVKNHQAKKGGWPWSSIGQRKEFGFTCQA